VCINALYRLIDAAGRVIRYGDAEYENHALEVKVIPGTVCIVVEDRY
jgi:hypothetical protein